MNDELVYEQPLNEKIRAFLRLEKLFQQYAYHLKHGSDWNNRIAIDSIIEIMAFTTRSDIKLEVLKELERQHTRLERLSRRPQIDQKQLSSILKNISMRMGELQAITGHLGQETKNVELINAISQKNSVPGSICDFDLPSLKYWLHTPKDQRRKTIERWFRPYGQLDRAIQLILDIIRHSAEGVSETASHGFYQKSLDTNQSIQLLRIGLPADADYFPEISGGKHRFSIRFLTNKDPAKRPEQCQQDITFGLQMCTI